MERAEWEKGSYIHVIATCNKAWKLIRVQNYPTLMTEWEQATSIEFLRHPDAVFFWRVQRPLPGRSGGGRRERHQADRQCRSAGPAGLHSADATRPVLPHLANFRNPCESNLRAWLRLKNGPLRLANFLRILTSKILCSENTRND